MEKINTEILLSSLMEMGFDKVDTYLYNYTLNQVLSDNSESQSFQFEDSGISRYFNEYIDCDGEMIQLKEGLSLDTMISDDGKEFYPLRSKLSTNQNLMEYLSNLDFRQIIVKKIASLNADRVDDFEQLFSDKEKEIINKMFGIGKMYRERKKQSEGYAALSSNERNIVTESSQIEEIIADIQARRQK